MTERHLLTIEALAVGGTITDAASDIGIDRSTVSRWVHKNPIFRAALNRRRVELRDELRGKLARAASAAATAVIDGLADPDVPAVVKLQTVASLLHKLSPLIDSSKCGCTDPEAIAREMCPSEAVRGMFDSSDPWATLQLIQESREELGLD